MYAFPRGQAAQVEQCLEAEVSSDSVSTERSTSRIQLVKLETGCLNCTHFYMSPSLTDDAGGVSARHIVIENRVHATLGVAKIQVLRCAGASDAAALAALGHATRAVGGLDAGGAIAARLSGVCGGGSLGWSRQIIGGRNRDGLGGRSRGRFGSLGRGGHVHDGCRGGRCV